MLVTLVVPSPFAGSLSPGDDPGGTPEGRGPEHDDGGGEWWSETGNSLAVVIVVLLVAGVGGGLFLGFGPGSGSGGGPMPTETPGSADGANGTATAPERPFSLAVDEIEACGRTCRDVTTTLTNERATAASNVTVYVRVHVGNGTDGDVVWRDREAIGALEGGESTTGTRRVKLSILDGYAVRRADGWITIRMTVQSREETVTITERRQVA